jgi:predicted RNase H-like HicB family nuclease
VWFVFWNENNEFNATRAVATSPSRTFCATRIDTEIKLTAVFRKFPQGYAAFVEELPGANTQGATLEEARENLKEAVAMVLQANRELAEESLRGADMVREPLALTTG